MIEGGQKNRRIQLTILKRKAQGYFRILCFIPKTVKVYAQSIER